MYEIGLSTPGFVNEQLFCDMAKAGIKHMEVSVDKQKSEQLDYGKLKEWSLKYGVNLWSFHLPFWPFDEIDISSPAIAEKTVSYLMGFIRKASEIGINKFVIHASGEPIKEEDRSFRMDIAKNSLYLLCEEAKKYGSVICVEDLPRTCLGRSSKDVLELLTAHPDLKVCFDTNHLLDEKITDFIYAIGDKIVTTHISDYDFNNERHWLPGEGDIDWLSLISALEDVNFNGVWLYEINLDCPWTIKRERNLTCEDFVNNANTIFNGKVPFSVGKRVDGLVHWTKGNG